MGKRGPQPKGKVSIRWSSGFAYAVGLVASDGCLSSNGRTIILVSRDKDQILNFLRALRIEAHIGRSSTQYGTYSYRVQIGDILFYRFLLSIGLTPAKSRTLGALDIPRKYFFDFLRGVFDGDGSTYSYYDKRWKSSFVFYLCFSSASASFLAWIRSIVQKELRAAGHMTRAKGHATLQLKYGKREGTLILHSMYASRKAICLKRKRLKIEQMLRIVGERL